MVLNALWYIMFQRIYLEIHDWVSGADTRDKFYIHVYNSDTIRIPPKTYIINTTEAPEFDASYGRTVIFQFEYSDGAFIDKRFKITFYALHSRPPGIVADMNSTPNGKQFQIFVSPTNPLFGVTEM